MSVDVPVADVVDEEAADAVVDTEAVIEVAAVSEGNAETDALPLVVA